ncbi:hypothetical protein GQX74_013704 [Glossina fuscipes]|nr:hypothetical protein GQX74_013704 [Glossina fuscipes]
MPAFSSLNKKPNQKNHIRLIWFYRENFDKILRKLKEKRSDKRFISTDVKHSSTKLTVSPPNPSSLSEIVCEKPIPFISVKTDVRTQADLWRSENRNISAILFKFLKSFVEQNPQLTSFSSKIEEERSINMEMKLPETVAQEKLENVIIEQSHRSKNNHQISRDCSEPFYFSIPFNDTKSFINNTRKFNRNYSYFVKYYLAETIDIYNKIVKPENEDETISTNDNEEYQFFQYLTEPCEVGLFSRNQVKVAAIAKNISKGCLVCHLDAKGNYIFYYALVITNHRGKNYPIAERIANTHDAGSIDDGYSFFENFKTKFIYNYNTRAEANEWTLLEEGKHWRLDTVKSGILQADGWSCGYHVFNFVEEMLTQKSEHLNKSHLDVLGIRLNCEN